tara:strand:+ start:1245 stop:1850 length:606 start_codon:yes stop_codon:yes gene_type:complete
MKLIRLIAVLVLIFSSQSLSKADDISEFEIEGMSIGESLLDYYSKSEIEKNNIDKGNEKKFKRILILDKRNPLNDQYKSIKTILKIYDGMHVYIDPSNKYLIYGISAMLDFEKNFSDCLDKKLEIEKEISDLFQNPQTTTGTFNHHLDETGNSKVYSTEFKIDPKNKFYELNIRCFDWSEKMGYVDHLRISIYTDEVNEMH